MQFNKEAFYLILPSWARLAFKWADLGDLFARPFDKGALARPDYWTRIGYKQNDNTFQLINGPAGNGIIKGIGDINKSRYLWMAVLLQQAEFRPLPGFPRIGFNSNLFWLAEKDTPENYLGLQKKSSAFLPLISLEYDEALESSICVSLVFKSTIPDKVTCSDFCTQCREFGIECYPIVHLGSLSKEGQRLMCRGFSYQWYTIGISDDIGLIVAKIFYVACLLKQSHDTFKFVHLIGAFEEKPTMARRWKEYLLRDFIRRDL